MLKDLHAARRRRRTAEFDPFEALYRAYLTGIILAVVVLVLSSVTGDTKVSAAEVANVRHHGAPFVGLAAALVLAVGLRSGGRGGPLVIEAADVRHVLLAPVDRAVALRGPAIRQLRFGALLGGAAGAIAGLLALRRLPGSPVALGGGRAPLAGAMAAAGRPRAGHDRRRAPASAAGSAALLALAVLGWSAADAAAGTVTSPASLLGQLALWPLAVHPLDVSWPSSWPGPRWPVGLAVVGGTAARGVGAPGQPGRPDPLRGHPAGHPDGHRAAPPAGPGAAPAAAVGAPAAVGAQGLARRPGRPPRPVDGPVAGDGGAAQLRAALPAWRRGWHGILRWPALRFARVAVLGAVAGLALVGVWRGTTPLVVVAGLALYVAGLDAVEPLAQEVDHPDRRDSYDLPPGSLHLRQLGAPAVLMVLVGGVGLAAALVATGGSATTAQVGGVLLVPAALAALGGAAVSVIKGPPPPLTPQQALIPEAAGARAMGRLLWPPLIAVLGVLPVLAAHSAAAPRPAGARPPCRPSLQPVILLDRRGGRLGPVRRRRPTPGSPSRWRLAKPPRPAAARPDRIGQ